MTVVFKKRGVYGYIDTSDLFSRGHIVYNWHAKIGRETKALAKLEAPERTGKLKKSIYSSGPDRTLGPRSNFLEVKVGARAFYAPFVHGGTTGPITAKNGKWLKISSMPGGGINSYSQPNDPFTSKKFGGVEVGKRFSGATTQIGFPNYVGSPPGVRGQDANPFLARAMDKVSRAHRWRAGRTRTYG